MDILQVSIADINGGAEKVAWDLHCYYLAQGNNAHLFVGWKRSCDDNVTCILGSKGSIRWLINRGLAKIEKYTGIQAWGYRGFLKWWRSNKKYYDVVHFHNLHSSYFDIGVLDEVCRTHPIIQTLHDCWTFTGHCAHPFDCKRWQVGCGSCPDLLSYPGIYLDKTKLNWQRRKKIYERVKPVLVCPSLWIKNMVEKSFLKEIRCEIIPNGIDFHPLLQISKDAIRTSLQLPTDKFILLFVANGGLRTTHYKDPQMLLNVLEILLRDPYLQDKVLLVSVGGEQVPIPECLSRYVKQFPYEKSKLELFYQSADIFVYPTKADTCPLVLLEAMMAGLPVVTTDVGGCGELVINNETGFVVTPGSSVAMAEAVKKLITIGPEKYGLAGAERARAKFTLQKMGEQYLDLYRDLIESKRLNNNGQN